MTLGDAFVRSDAFMELVLRLAAERPPAEPDVLVIAAPSRRTAVLL